MEHPNIISHVPEERIEIDGAQETVAETGQHIYLYYFPRDREARRRLHSFELKEAKRRIKKTPSFLNRVGIRAGLIFTRRFGRERWLCKVGAVLSDNRTARQRIAEQIGTSQPELPKVAFWKPVPDAEAFENALHDRLKQKYRHFNGGAGTEWFVTNPREVERLFRQVEKLFRKNAK